MQRGAVAARRRCLPCRAEPAKPSPAALCSTVDEPHHQSIPTTPLYTLHTSPARPGGARRPGRADPGQSPSPISRADEFSLSSRHGEYLSGPIGPAGAVRPDTNPSRLAGARSGAVHSHRALGEGRRRAKAAGENKAKTRRAGRVSSGGLEGWWAGGLEGWRVGGLEGWRAGGWRGASQRQRDESRDPQAQRHEHGRRCTPTWLASVPEFTHPRSS